MAKSARQYEMNMTEGPLLGKILRFSLPLAVTGIKEDISHEYQGNRTRN